MSGLIQYCDQKRLLLNFSDQNRFFCFDRSNHTCVDEIGDSLSYQENFEWTNWVDYYQDSHSDLQLKDRRARKVI